MFLLLFCFCGIASAKKQEIPISLLDYEQGIKLHKEGDLQNAVLYLSDSYRLNPTDLPTLIELGEVFIGLSKYDLAISTLKQALNLSPDDALIHILLGDAYHENKQYNEAISYYKRAIKLEPENILIRTNLGLVCSQIADYKCVVDNLGKVVLAYPLQIRARAALGTAYHLSKDYGLAKEQYKFVLNYEPNNLSLWYNLAKTQLALGEYKEAKASIDKAITIDNSVVDLYLDRAHINYKLNKLQDAENDYLVAIQLDPLNPVVPVEYATFLSRTGAFLKAANELQKALELEPGDLNLLINKAYLLQLAKQDKEAILNWLKVLEKDDSNKTALFNLASLYQEKEDYRNAIEYYKKLLVSLDKEGSKGDLEAKTGLAFCLQKNKNLEEAKLVYEKILEKSPNDSNILYNLGVLLNEEKNYAKAVEYLESAIKNNFSPPGLPYQALVEAYLNLNDTTKIKTAYKNWLEADKNNIEARIAYAKFLAHIGDSRSAVDQYRVAAALDNTSSSRYKLAQFLLDGKDLYGAVGELQEYLKSEPNDLNALILLANIFRDLGIPEQAINTYKKIISIQVDNHLAYYNLGLLYQQEKKYVEAQNYLLKSIEINDKYSPAYYALALTYISNNESNKAKDLFEKYLKLEPNGEYKDKAEAKLKELISNPNVANGPKA